MYPFACTPSHAPLRRHTPESRERARLAAIAAREAEQARLAAELAAAEAVVDASGDDCPDVSDVRECSEAEEGSPVNSKDGS